MLVIKHVAGLITEKYVVENCSVLCFIITFLTTPLPIKHPLRMVWEITNDYEGTVVYIRTCHTISRTYAIDQ